MMRTRRAVLRRCARASALAGALLAVPAYAATAAEPAPDLALGKRLFAASQPPCAVCHALADAGAEGAVGPSLDDLKPDAARVAKALRDGIGAMPSFRDKLSEHERRSIAAYVAKASGGKP